MKKMYLFAAIFGIMSFAACDSDESPKPNTGNENENPEVVEKPVEEDIFNAKYSPRKAITLGATQQEVGKEMNQFAWKLFAKTYENKKDMNLMTSPYSLVQNLLMLSNGLQGETLDEIKSALDIETFSMEDLNQYIAQLNKGMEEADARTKYRTDNGIWYQKATTMLPDFSTNVAQYYKAETFPATMDAQTLESINDWANERTYGRIPQMLDYLDPGTQAVLMNTVYFRGLWQDELTDKNVKEGIFYNENGTAQKAQMVSYPKTTTYTEGETYQTTCRSFGNEAYVMDFILPKEGASAEDVLTEYVDNLDKIGEAKIVELSFPCFESASKMELAELLRSIGINKVFDGTTPEDFQLFDAPCFVSDIIQKTSITVDERGAEAAAGTYTVVDGVTGEKPETVTMTLDRPFFYTIRETSTNTPLFIGYQGSVAK